MVPEGNLMDVGLINYCFSAYISSKAFYTDNMNMKGKTYSYILMFKRAMLSLCTDKIDTHVVTPFFYCIVFYHKLI